MRYRNIALTTILLVAAGALTFGWYKHMHRQTACGYCLRPLHNNLTVTAEIAGKQTQVCCASCAISEANQEHKHLRLIQVHDYPTGQALSPEKAWFVEGSRATACNHDAMRMDEMKQTQELTYDRCSPGTFAFAKKADADAFIVKNGGSVISIAQLMSEARFQ